MSATSGIDALTNDAADIDAVTIAPDRLSVRGVDLLSLIDSVGFVAAISHVLTARVPDAQQDAELDRYLGAALRSAPDSELDRNGSDALALIEHVARRQRKPEAFLAAAVAANLAGAPTDVMPPLPAHLHSFDRAGELAIGLRIVASMPRLLSIWLATNQSAAPPGPRGGDTFSAGVLRCLATGEHDERRAHLFDVLLVALHGGFGIVAPTIALPRFSASTYAGIDMNLVAGMTGSGPVHIGACSNATRFFGGLIGKPAATIRKSVGERVRANGRIPGFGHPLLDRDPRPDVLERHVVRLGCASAAFDAYRTVCDVMRDERGLHPNIDSVAAAILLELGVPAELATPVFLFARMPTMLAHALQKKTRPPFGQTRAVARQRLATLPTAWI